MKKNLRFLTVILLAALCLLFAGGMLILLPLGLVAGAFMLGKACA